MTLTGHRVVITRPRAQADDIADRVRALGGHPVFLPLLTIEPPSDGSALSAALRDIASFDWVILTSINAARAVVDALQCGHPRPRVATVGPVTAAFVERAGVPVSVIPDLHGASEIPQHLGAIDGCRVLVPHGDLADDTLSRALVAAGALVHDVIAYRTVIVAELSTDLRREATGCSAYLFMSGSAVRAFHSLGLTTNDGLVACIGPATSDVAAALGYTVDVIAPVPTATALVDAVASVLRNRGRLAS